MTNDLFLAILAMDAYNRTGGASPVGLVMPSGTIGNATVLSGPSGSLEDTNTGFYAQAYELPDGTKVISYRGTDDSKDVWYGWRVGGGSFTAAQAPEAARFYQQVVAGSADTSNLSLTNLYDGDIVLTGHSLGGGLAGFVGSLYGASDVRLFDTMSYEYAAFGAYRAAIHNLSDHYADSQFAKDAYFLGGEPGQPIDGDDISSFSVEGQAIAGLASGASQTTFSLGFSSPATLGPIQRHSSSLLVIAIYGSTSPTVSSKDWRAAGNDAATFAPRPRALNRPVLPPSRPFPDVAPGPIWRGSPPALRTAIWTCFRNGWVRGLRRAPALRDRPGLTRKFSLSSLAIERRLTSKPACTRAARIDRIKSHWRACWRRNSGAPPRRTLREPSLGELKPKEKISEGSICTRCAARR